MGGDEEQLIMGRLRIRANPVQLGSAKAGTELDIGNMFVTRVLNSFIHETECLQGNKQDLGLQCQTPLRLKALFR